MGVGTSLLLAISALGSDAAGAYGFDPSSQLSAWKRAAVAGDAEAALKLGQAYKRGDLAPLDAQEAERWFARAAQSGSVEGEAQYGLVLLHNGKPREAVPWLRKAAARGDPRARYAYATLLFNGVGVPRDEAQAQRLMRQAADAGLPAAKEALAVMAGPLPEEPGAPQSPAKAPSVPAAFGGWYVQVGAFAQRGNADRLWARLKPLGPPTLKPEFKPDNRLTRLLVGPFEDGGSAEAYCRKLQAADLSCFVTQS